MDASRFTARSPRDSAPRPRAVAGLRPEPAGVARAAHPHPIPVPATASASTPRARAHAARSRRSNAAEIFRPFAWPGGIARERFPRSSCSSRRCPSTRGRIYEAWCPRVPVGRSQRHAPGREQFPFPVREASDGQRDAMACPAARCYRHCKLHAQWRINVPNTHSRP